MFEKTKITEKEAGVSRFFKINKSCLYTYVMKLAFAIQSRGKEWRDLFLNSICFCILGGN